MSKLDEDLKQALNDIIKKDLNLIVRLKRLEKVYNFVIKSKKILPDWRILKGVVWSKVSKPDLSKIKNEKLKNRVKELYRDNSKIGNGSTSDAIRYEKKTGFKVGDKFHKTKGELESKALKNLIESGKLSDSDKSLAGKLLKDLTNAMNGK